MPPAETPIAEVRRGGLEGPEHLAHVHDALAELWRLGAQALPSDDQWRIEFEIAVAEIAANVAQYVASHPTPVTFSLVLVLHHSEAVAVFEDAGGEPILPEAINLPDETAEAGRGLAIAERCLDVLRFERVQAVNRWNLVKNLPRPA